MSLNDIDSVTKQLEQTSVDSAGVVSFATRGLKLDTAKDAQEIIDALEKTKSVKTLILQGNTLGVAAAKELGKALETHPEFERALWSDIFTGRLKSEIPEALQYLGNGIITAQAKLVELDLSDNAFGPNGMNGLMTFLQSDSCFSLQILRLHNNGLGVTGGKMLAECLLECHKRSVEKGRPLALRVFQSGRGRLENEGSTALAKAFKAMGSLEEVVMPQNGIYHEGITALAEAFIHNKNLQHLNLQDNTLTPKGAKSLAKALCRLENLRVINFGDCLLKTKGAIILADALCNRHPKLETLNLTYNEIHESGAIKIAEAMEDKLNLTSLELDGNALGGGGKELVQGTMEALGKLDQLGSLSEDDDDAEEEENQDEDDDLEIIENYEGSTNHETSVVTVVDFLKYPSPTKFRQLGSQKKDVIMDHVGASGDVEQVVGTVMKMSTIVTSDDNTTKETVCECSDALLERLFANKEENTAANVANTVLVYLGLLKSEDKKFQVVGDNNGRLLVLSHIVKQQYFPKSSKDILSCFICRPHSSVDKFMTAKHQLLSALIQ